MGSVRNVFFDGLFGLQTVSECWNVTWPKTKRTNDCRVTCYSDASC